MARRMTAAYGGSISVPERVVLPGMYGMTYPISVAIDVVNEKVRASGLDEFVRWEYAPADRASVILSARGAALWTSRPRTRRKTIVRRLIVWWRRRAAGGAPATDAEPDPA